MSQTTRTGRSGAVNRIRDRVVIIGRVADTLEGVRLLPSRHAGGHRPKKQRNQKGRRR